MLVFVIFVKFLILVTSEEAFVSQVLSNKKSSNYLKFGGMEYYFGTATKVNFFEASRLCKFEEMELAHIDWPEENERLGIFATQIGLGHDHFWLSGNNLHDYQEWVWLSNGKLLKYTNWYPGEPNMGASGHDLTERCMEARTLDKGHFTWNNVPCERSYYYICKRGKNICSNVAKSK